MSDATGTPATGSEGRLRKGDRLQHKRSKKIGTAAGDEHDGSYGRTILVQWDDGTRSYIKAAWLRKYEGANHRPGRLLVFADYNYPG